MSLTRDDLTDSVQKATRHSKSRSKELVDSTLELIKGTLASGEDVLISGFGKFEVRDKPTRRGRNPQTGGELTLDARRVVTFKCSGVLRRELNGGRDGKEEG